MTWPQVALAAINMVQVVALAALAIWAQSLRRETKQIHAEVERINGELADAIERTFESSDARGRISAPGHTAPRSTGHDH